MSNDSASASAAANFFVRLYPRNPHIDYVYYMKGLANYYRNHSFIQQMLRGDEQKRDVSHYETAYADFKFLIARYPHSHYIPDARKTHGAIA